MMTAKSTQSTMPHIQRAVLSENITRYANKQQNYDPESGAKSAKRNISRTHKDDAIQTMNFKQLL
jgi:hypothetical protein